MGMQVCGESYLYISRDTSQSSWDDINFLKQSLIIHDLYMNDNTYQLRFCVESNESTLQIYFCYKFSASKSLPNNNKMTAKY